MWTLLDNWARPVAMRVHNVCRHYCGAKGYPLLNWWGSWFCVLDQLKHSWVCLPVNLSWSSLAKCRTQWERQNLLNLFSCVCFSITCYWLNQISQTWNKLLNFTCNICFCLLCDTYWPYHCFSLFPFNLRSNWMYLLTSLFRVSFPLLEIQHQILRQRLSLIRSSSM